MIDLSEKELKREIEIRLFVSSTFRDMQRERDRLVKVVFPHLRKICRSRGVHLTEVDLRWGVTEEQSQQGKAIEVCLREVDRCRPYFIALLGERYGWIPMPNEYEKNRRLIEDFPWIKNDIDQGLSITEMEIQYGVLRSSPGMHNRAFFYCRSLCLTPPGEQYHERPGSPEEIKLRKLKETIKCLAGNATRDYSTIPEFGAMVVDDLTSVINNLHPGSERTSPLQQTWLDHATFARSKLRIYIGGQKYVRQLETHVAGTDKPLVVTGAPGAGKSALLANWIAHHQYHHPEDFILYHFVGSVPNSAHPVRLARRIMEEIKTRFGVKIEIPSQADKIVQALPLFLEQSLDVRRWILVIDGLDQLEEQDDYRWLGWLPESIPENVRVILSTTPGQALDACRKRSYPEIAVEDLAISDRKRVIQEYLGLYTKELPPKAVQEIASDPKTGNPLVLRTLLDELRIYGVHEDLHSRIRYYLKPYGTIEFFDALLSRLERDYEQEKPGLVKDVLSLLWASRRGLFERELLQLTGVAPLLWEPLYNALENLLLNRDGLLAFSHDFLRKTVETRYLNSSSEMIRAHQRLATYYSQVDMGQRRIEEFPWQLLQSKQWRYLHDVLSEPDFLLKVCENDHLDANLYWAGVEANSQYRAIDAYRAMITEPRRERFRALKTVAVLLRELGYSRQISSLYQFLDENADTFEKMDMDLRLASLKRDMGDDFEARRLTNEVISRCRRGIFGVQVMEEATASHQTKSSVFRADSPVSLFMWGYFKTLLAEGLLIRATLHFDGGEYDEALSNAIKSEEILREIGNRDGLQRCLGELALIYTEFHEFSDALALLSEKERICRETGNMIGVQNTLGYKANIKSKVANYYEAKLLLKQKERICSSLGLRKELVRTIKNYIHILLLEREYDAVMQECKRLENICCDMGYEDELEEARELVVRALMKQRKSGLAQAFLNDCLQHYYALGQMEELQEFCGLLAEDLYFEGALDEALGVLSGLERYLRMCGANEALDQCLANEALILFEELRPVEALTALREKAEICCRLGRQDEHLAYLDEMIVGFQAEEKFEVLSPLRRERQRIAQLARKE